MSNTYISHHMHAGDVVRATVRIHVTTGKPYAEVELSDRSVLYAGEPELRRLRDVVDMALAGLAEVTLDAVG